MVELVQDVEEASVSLAIGSAVEDTEGSLSLFNVTGGKPENKGPGGQTQTPGPGPKPKSSIPPPPQKKHPHSMGTIVCWPSEPVVVVCVFVVIPVIVPKDTVEASVAVDVMRGPFVVDDRLPVAIGGITIVAPFESVVVAKLFVPLA